MWKTESAKAHEVIKLGLVRLMGVGVGVYDGKDLWIFCLYLERGKEWWMMRMDMVKETKVNNKKTDGEMRWCISNERFIIFEEELVGGRARLVAE